MLRNGLFYKAQDVQKKECEVIDDNIVRHVGMTKISSGNKTPFQLLLEKIHSDQSILNDFDKLAQQLFDITPLKKANKSRLMSEKDQAIIDANNDNFRRFFESVFAKKILKYILNQESVSELRTMLQEISAFLIREYHDYDKNFLSLWEASRNGAKVKENDSLSFFSELRPDLVALMKEDHFSDAKKDTMLKLYDLHYMTHAISKLTSYKKRHPEGIVEIYDNEYKKRNTFYRPDHRGRVAGFGFAKDNPSYHLGIFRSHDQTPYDMRKTSLNPVTRCPDRLYMEHPKVARLDPYNWLHHCFSNGNNSCYVNGLSGSILLEIRSLLFFISALKDNYYSCVVLKPDALFKNNNKLIKDYFLLIIGLFVYFEGGHTFSEILSPFDIKEVREAINIGLRTTSSVLSKQTLLFDNPKIKDLMKESLMETVQFYSVYQAKTAVHKQILSANPLFRLKSKK